MKKSLAVFISGQGSNLSVFLQNKNKFKNLIVVSSNEKAYGLKKAERFGVKTFVLSTPVDWDILQQKLVEWEVDLIFLAGFMKIVPVDLINQWESKIFNLHPSLLPKYKGLKSIERAFNDKEAIGVSIHRVTSEVDAGEIIFQEEALSVDRVKEFRLDQAEFYTHVCEQKLVGQWVNQWA